MGKIWGREPALILGAVTAFISLTIAFGLHLTDNEVGAIMAFVVAVLSFVTRSQVTPVKDPVLPEPVDPLA